MKSLGDGLEATLIKRYEEKTSSYLKHNAFRVSDASHLQHAYEIKDFGSTGFRTDRFVTMLSTAGAIHIYSKMPEQEQTIPDTCPPLSPHRRFRMKSASTL